MDVRSIQIRSGNCSQTSYLLQNVDWEMEESTQRAPLNSTQHCSCAICTAQVSGNSPVDSKQVLVLGCGYVYIPQPVICHGSYSEASQKYVNKRKWFFSFSFQGESKSKSKSMEPTLSGDKNNVCDYGNCSYLNRILTIYLDVIYQPTLKVVSDLHTHIWQFSYPMKQK